MSKRKKDILSIKDDVEFLEAYQKKVQQWYIDLDYICKEDLIETNKLPTTSPDAERVARLADEYGFDGSLFRVLFPVDEPLSPQSIRRLEKKIETIPRIIKKIEKTDKTEQGWKIENGQVLYNGIDLQFPPGHIQEVLEKLVESEGKTVLNNKLEKIATGKHRHHISKIRKYLKSKNVPYEIKTVTYEGYKLQKK